ncbi:aminoglycoside phosphotransferase family protein [Streptomyces sp. NPDC013978]|uniref:aminoglycoside phosphotransferase family protein n=1 Tax=Streptomyces sp. NPDC013978 TaxID=3364869 RepID=UPI0036F8BDD8
MHIPDGAGHDFVRLAQQSGTTNGGHHNRNYVLSLSERMAGFIGEDPGTRVLVRAPRPDVIPVVIRTWPDEAELLDRLADVLPHVPRCLAKTPTATVLSYVEGTPLSRLCPAGKPLEPLWISELAQLLASTTAVRRDALPALPPGWPSDDQDSQGYLRTLALLADAQIRKPSWKVYGGLFTALGVPEDALARLAADVPSMTRRPYSLLHGDLHRDNVIVTEHGHPRLVAVDWELATYGDPVHDLATHLVRTRYPEFQKESVIAAWAAAIEPIMPAAADGICEDLPHYIAFEQAQSVFPDVIRAVQSLPADPSRGGMKDTLLHEVESAVLHALQAGAEPLNLQRLPSASRVRDILCNWETPGRAHRPLPRTAIKSRMEIAEVARIS